MGNYSTNAEILHIWVNGTTGQAGNMADTLTRYPGDGTEVSAAETVTVTEIGSTGTYEVKYTPVTAQTYRLRIQNTVTFQEAWWEDDVGNAPSSGVDGDGYCSLGDVEARTGMTYTSSSKPTDAVVRGFIRNRAATIYARLSSVLGDGAPAPANYPETVVIDTTVDRGQAMTEAARDVNCQGAAADALASGGAGESPAQSDRITNFMTMYNEGLDLLREVAETYGLWSNESATFITDGDEAGELPIQLDTLRF